MLEYLSSLSNEKILILVIPFAILVSYLLYKAIWHLEAISKNVLPEYQGKATLDLGDEGMYTEKGNYHRKQGIKNAVCFLSICAMAFIAEFTVNNYL